MAGGGNGRHCFETRRIGGQHRPQIGPELGSQHQCRRCGGSAEVHQPRGVGVVEVEDVPGSSHRHYPLPQTAGGGSSRPGGRFLPAGGGTRQPVLEGVQVPDVQSSGRHRTPPLTRRPPPGRAGCG